MISIEKAYLKFENKTVSVEEFNHYRVKYPHRKSVNELRCIECGDRITFCKGEKNVPYFKHSIDGDCHKTCKLYHEGKTAYTLETIIKKKFVFEEDISFNFEIRYNKGRWKALMILPPFSKSEIEQHALNKTTLRIYESNTYVDIEINNKKFYPGETKAVGLLNFPSSISIDIIGKDKKNKTRYDLKGFIPRSQIYSSLILQNYVSYHDSRIIDLRKIDTFACKRIEGKVYTGKHYLFFSVKEKLHLDFKDRTDIEIKKIIFESSHNFNYCAYDILFKKDTNFTRNFCLERECVLVEHDEAIIVWPPIKTKGNNKYLEKIDFNKQESSNIFIAFQNEERIIELKRFCLCDIFLRISNINSTPFYIMNSIPKEINKEKLFYKVISVNEIKNYSNYKAYLYRNNTLFSKYDNHTKLNKNNSVLLYNSPLDKISTLIDNQSSDKNKILESIRYSRKYIKFNEMYFDFLNKKYKDDELIINYINHCKRVGTIKKETLRLLVEGE